MPRNIDLSLEESMQTFYGLWVVLLICLGESGKMGVWKSCAHLC